MFFDPFSDGIVECVEQEVFGIGEAGFDAFSAFLSGLLEGVDVEYFDAELVGCFAVDVAGDAEVDDDFGV